MGDRISALLLELLKSPDKVRLLKTDNARLEAENHRLRAAAIQQRMLEEQAKVPGCLDLRDLFAEWRAPRDPNTLHAVSNALAIFALTYRFARQVLSQNLSSREGRAILEKLQAAHSALRRPGRPALSDDDLRQEVAPLRECYQQFRRLVDDAGGQRNTALSDLKAAYRAAYRGIAGGGPTPSPDDAEALRRVGQIAPGLLTRSLDVRTLWFLRKTQRLTEPGFIAQVLAGYHGGAPASYRRRVSRFLRSTSS